MEGIVINERIGEIKNNSKGTPMRIIEYRKSNDIDIEFLDEFHYVMKNQTYSNFKKGCIKNPYDKNICGVGCMGVGKYYSKNPNGTHTYEYQNWIAMIRRCYDKVIQTTYPSYYGICTVCNDWHNFQTFGKWYEENFYQVGTERMHLDKDILFENNREYSPDKCLIVPQRINMLFKEKRSTSLLPTGVQSLSSGKYSATYNGKHLGTFETIELTARAHDIEKKNAIIRVANEYKDKIPDKVYNALINWKSSYMSK